MPLSPIPEILEELRAGRVIVLVDDEDRENEGDFVCAAERITVDIINFMTRVGAGYLCVALTGPDCDRLELGPQTPVNTSVRGTPLTISVDGHPRHGVGTGISAYDRVRTTKLLIDPATTPDDLVRPGHVNPLRARVGGVLVRSGQTEGSIDLMRLAGLHPSAVLIEIVKEDGEMAQRPDLERLCGQHGLKLCSVEQVIEHRLGRERLVERMDPVDGTLIETPEGPFNLIAYRSRIDPLPHLALTVGDVGLRNGKGAVVPSDEPTLVRMHRRDLLGDIFNERSNPTGHMLRTSMRLIQDEGRGVIVYLRPEGCGDDFRSRLQAIRRPHPIDVDAPDLTRADGVAGRAQPAEQRDVGMGSQILRDLGLHKLRILTNHPKTPRGLAGFGLEIVEQVGLGSSEIP